MWVYQVQFPAHGDDDSQTIREEWFASRRGAISRVREFLRDVDGSDPLWSTRTVTMWPINIVTSGRGWLVRVLNRRNYAIDLGPSRSWEIPEVSDATSH